jgi:hypothetical protein
VIYFPDYMTNEYCRLSELAPSLLSTLYLLAKTLRRAEG